MGLKRTTVYLPAELHRALRMRASAAGTTLSALVVQAVTGLVDGPMGPDGLAEPAPAYGEAAEESRVRLEREEKPGGLLAAVGAWEGVEGLDELDGILAEARQGARDRAVEPLDR